MTSKYTKILTALRAATGQDRYLSTWVHTALQPLEDGDCTASIDAALAIVAEKLPGWTYQLISNPLIGLGRGGCRADE